MAERYELVWATTWDPESANALAETLGWPPLPAVHFDYDRRSKDGFEFFKSPAVRDHAGERPFAWLDDKVTWSDAVNLVDQHHCLIIRTDIKRGIEPRHLDVLASWVKRQP